MNRVKNHLFALLLIGVFYCSCKKDPPATPASTSNFPQALHDTFGYDGYAGRNLTPTSPSLLYQNGVLTLNISYWIGNETTLGMDFSIHARQIGVYLLSNKDRGGQSENDGRGGSAGWTTDSTHTGQVTLTELDTIHHIASGTFWYNDTIEAYSSASYAPKLSSVKNGFFTLNY